MAQQISKLQHLADIIKKVSPDLAFSILEIGAAPLEGETEPFYQLIDAFPGSRITAFEVEEELCAKLNDSAKNNVRYYPVALGGETTEQPFYETVNPVCCSLYRPDDELLEHYNGLEIAMFKSAGKIKTERLDDFILANNIGPIDFIKIDIQGAELDVFKSGTKTLSDVDFIISEVEFIPLYIEQPLFGDVCQFLTGQDIMFHKFLGLAGRTLKPIVIENNVNYASQHMWADAVFIRDIRKLSGLAPDRLLKMALLSFMYGSPDVACFCLIKYDEIENSSLYDEFVNS